MILERAFKVFLFSVFFCFFQQGLAKDTYDLEEFRQYFKKSWNPPSKEQQEGTDNSIVSPFENIRIGFFRLNLTADDVSGDDRLEIHNDFWLDEQDFRNLSNFYFNYVNIGDSQHRHGRIQKILRLIFRIFTINTTTENSPEDQELIQAMAKSLFEPLFYTRTNDDGINPYYGIFNPNAADLLSHHININNSLALMFFTFLGPYVLPMNTFLHHSHVLVWRITRNSYHQALSNSLLSGNISEYHSPQSFANQLKAANLDTETALIIGLSSMARASTMCTNLHRSWPETLESLLQKFLSTGILDNCYNTMSLLRLGPFAFASSPEFLHSYQGMREFAYNILGLDIDLTPSRVLAKESYAHSGVPGNLSGHSPQDNSSCRNSDSAWRSENKGSNNETTLEAGAIVGATGGSQECLICSKSLEDKTIPENAIRSVVCKDCIKNILKD
ncbi:hypothetical protein [Endozoicomonas sp. 8E]|uniref:hypothetical protein n=1 Tax=Endozoicomonas sp. 8E TaxID=3035692 RepID=UPI0029394D01|nr:hypothetical protein [Endozoicomonas sp. 8E]WOG26771.1 hypothetical protein P6910_19810 [Endozoicomonas sp. 8E]